MRKWLLLFLLLPLKIFAATWFVSPTGNDGNSGTSSGSPFLTLARVQTAYHAGDIIELQCNGTYIGTLTISAASQVIKYGSGTQPLISGFETLSGWASVGTNLWRVHDANLGATVKVFTINGTQYAPGRFPKVGYSIYTASTANTSITAAGLAGTWGANAQVVIRKNHFNMTTYPIVSVVGNVITYSGGSGDVPTPGSGAFIQNSLNALSQNGDWYYDGAGNITLYWVGTPPVNIQASRYDRLINITSGSGAIVNGINLTGANAYAIYGNNTTSAQIVNCTITQSDIGVYLNNNTSSIINGCIFNQINGNSITLATSNSNTINNTTVTTSGMIPGIATEYSGIRVIPNTARNTIITNSTVSNTGYNGYFVQGQVTMQNDIGHDCLNLLDDGAIYYFDVGQTAVTIPASVVSNCIGYNANGAPVGTNDGKNEAVVFYADDNTNHFTFSHCVGYNAGQYIFFSHNNQNVTWSNCLGYNAGISTMAMIHDRLGGKLSNITLANNQFINTIGQILILRSIWTDSTPADLTNWGVATNNAYGNNVTVANPFQTQLYSQPVQNLTFAGWKTATGQDGSSSYQTIPSPSALYPNPTSTSTTTTLSAVYKDLLGNSYSGVTSIAAYSALYLYYFGAIPPVAPSISYSPNNYTFYVNDPIPSPITPVNVGGAMTSAAINTPQPSGILFNTTTAVFTGTPLALSPSHTYTVNGINAGGSSSTPITFAIIDHPPVVSYNNSPQTATINVAMTPMSPTLVSGGAVTNYTSATALPAGVTINSVSGVISGVPTVLIPLTTFNINCSNSGGVYVVPIQLGVTNPAPALPHVTYSPSTVVLPINISMVPLVPTSTGGVVASYSAASLPVGVSLNTSTGVVSGTPTTLTSPTVYPIIAHNVTGDYTTNITLSVINTTPNPPVPSYNPATVVFQLGHIITPMVPFNSSDPATSWSIAPAVSAGLSFSLTTGILTGTPSALSPVTSYTVRADNTGGHNNTTITLSVVNPPPTPVIRVRTSKHPIFINRH